jgi:glutamine amidotransferase-like uncharacterized protein
MRRFAIFSCLLVAIPLLAAEPAANTIKVAIYKGKGTSDSQKTVLAALEKLPEVKVTILSAEDIQAGKLKDFDVIIHSGGSGGAQGKALGEDGRKQVKEFVEGGGGYVGICAGAYLASRSYDWSLHILDAEVIDRQHWARGFGDVDLKFSPKGKEFFDASKEKVSIHYYQGPLLAPGNDPKIPDYTPLATFDTEIAKNGAPKGIMIGTTAIAQGEFGRGKVIVFSPHPEKFETTQTFIKRALEWTQKK